MELASNSGKRNRYLDARKRNGRINVEERGIRKGSLGAVSFLRDDSVINFLLAERERERALSPCGSPLFISATRGVYPLCVHYSVLAEKEREWEWENGLRRRMEDFQCSPLWKTSMAPPHLVPFRFLSPGALPPCGIKLVTSRVKSLIGVFIEKRLRRDLSSSSGRGERELPT